MRNEKWSVKVLSCFLVLAMALTTAVAMPTMNAQAATKKAAMSKSSVTLIVDKTYTLSVNNAKGKATWNTSDKKIATVSKTGDRSAKITAKKTGTATITAKIGSKKYTCKVKVENPKLSATSKTLNAKDAKTATLQLNGTSQGSSVKWATSNSKIISIKASKNKVTMTAKKAGSATVTATVGGKKFSCKVTVEKSHNYKKGKTVAATCSKKGYTEYKCACGKSYKKSINATGKHSYTVKKDTVAATCTKDGYTVYRCKTCDKTTKKTIKAIGHKYGEWVVVKEATATEDGLKSKTCSVCCDVVEEIIPATGETHEHTWDGGKVSKEATCTEEGVMTYTCTVCGETKIEKIPVTEHQYETKTTTVVEEACDEEVEKKVYYCTACMEEFDTNEELWQHIYDAQDGKIDGHPNYGSGSSKVVTTTIHRDAITKTTTEKVCKTCGKAECEEHSFGEWVVTKPATTTEMGFQTRTCTKCGATETVDIAKLEEIDTPEHTEHTWDAGVVTTDATCVEEGEKTYTCTVCSQTKTEKIPVTDHQYEAKTTMVVEKEAYDEVMKKTVYYCTGCKEEFDNATDMDKHIDDAADGKIDGHPNYGSISSKVVKTTIHHDAITKTTTEKACKTCGKAECEEHSFGEWIVTKPATTTEMGSQTRTCSKCGATETVDIEKLEEAEMPEHTEHQYESKTTTVVEKEAYDEEVKKTVYYCTGCKAEFDNSDELVAHLDDAEEGKIEGHPNYGSMASKVVKTTIHHDAITKTITEQVCKICGHVKEA